MTKTHVTNDDDNDIITMTSGTEHVLTMIQINYTVSQTKRPSFKLSLTFQILIDFQNILQCKNFENRLRFDKVIDSLKVGRFFET